MSRKHEWVELGMQSSAYAEPEMLYFTAPEKWMCRIGHHDDSVSGERVDLNPEQAIALYKALGDWIDGRKAME